MTIERRYILIVAATLASVILLSFTIQRGKISYFSPYTLQFQGQSEYTVLGGSIPIWRTSLEDYDSKILRYLRESEYIMPVNPKHNRWEIGESNAWTRDGGFDRHYLLGRNNSSVIEWSKADPERARIYWSEGFKCVRSEDRVEVYIGEEILQQGWKAKSIPELLEKIATIRKEIEFEHQWKINESKKPKSPSAEQPPAS